VREKVLQYQKTKTVLKNKKYHQNTKALSKQPKTVTTNQKLAIRTTNRIFALKISNSKQ